jgi:RNA polymerase sigma-70 factor (ECF subfamily)
MSDPVLDRLERVLVAERPRLVGVAYRITGSRVEAEDIVQEAWIRARRAGAEAIEKPEAWLTTVVSRLALDSLRSAHHRREAYVGPFLPEPVLTGPAAEAPATPPWGVDAGPDPADMAERAESLTFGFLRVLDTLAPVERVVFLLADVFDMPYGEIAEVVGRSSAACRQVASRARRRVRGARPGHAPPTEAVRVAGELIGALGRGDVDAVVSLLGDGVVLLSDGGADHRAARHPIVGRDRVARFLGWIVRRWTDVEVEGTTLNGEPGVVVRAAGERYLAIAIQVAEAQVTGVHIVVNPDKLAALDLDGPVG